MNITSRIPALRWAALALPGLLALAAHATPFSLLRDTVDIRSGGSAATDLILNAGTDSLVFDSVSARLVSTMTEAQLSFYLYSGTEPNYTLSKSFFATKNSPSSQQFWFLEGGRFVVKAQTTARISFAAFDACIRCPTAKSAAAQRALAVGDTIRAWVRFHSGADKDSVLFLAVQRISGSSLAPSGRLRPNFGALPQRPVDASGRALRAPARHTLNAPAKP